MRRSLTLIVVIALAGCSKKPAELPPAPAPQVTAVPQPTAGPELSLFDRLTREADQKDKSDPSTQQVMDALTKAGLALSAAEQRMGAGIGARYCSRVLAERLAIIVCEYSDAKSAQTGGAGAEKAFAAVAGQTVDVKRSTTMTVIDSFHDEASAASVKKARAAFNAL